MAIEGQCAKVKTISPVKGTARLLLKDLLGEDRKRLVPHSGSKKEKDSGETGQASGLPDHPYFEENGKLWTKGEKGPILLANFVARIREDVTRHEAGKARTRYVVTATHSDASVGCRETTVDADDFLAMRWPYSMGASFSIGAGRGVA